MGLPIIFLGLLLLQTSFATTDDAFDGLDLFSPEDDNTEMDTYLDRKARNEKFLRFGRRFFDYETSNDIPYYDNEAQRLTRTGSLNGDPQKPSTRDKTIYLRFGRSITEENKKKRGKRGAVPVVPTPEALKRHESFLRFGRNSNFMRFGRNLGHVEIPHYSVEDALLRQIADSRNEHLINYLNNLLKQSKDNLGQNEI